MEHIVQFAIGIDDEAITKRIQDNAEKVITQKIQQDVEKTIFVTDYRGNVDRMTYVAETLFMKWLDDHKDEIVSRASEALAKKMVNTKAVKTAINNVLEGDMNASN